MRKLSIPSLALAAVAVFWAGAAQADQLADIKQKGTLVCGTLGIAEPFSFPNPQTRETQGYDVDFCAALAKSLGVKLELKLISVPARIAELQQGRVGVLAANLGWTPERAEQIAFSDSYYVSLTKVASRHVDGFKKPTDLAGKRVAASVSLGWTRCSRCTESTEGTCTRLTRTWPGERLAEAVPSSGGPRGRASASGHKRLFARLDMTASVLAWV